MKINIKRYNEKYDEMISYTINSDKTLLNAFEEIKENQDNTFAFRSGCKSGICGSCSVKVNGAEKLACKTCIKNEDKIEAINHYPIIKDLVVNLDKTKTLIKRSKSYIEKNSNKIVKNSDEEIIDIQSTCILCQSCYSSCPVIYQNEDFLGPYALTRTLRYINDKKEVTIDSKLEAIQDNGIWDCTLCGNCTIACPQNIDSKTDIMNLRMKSVQNGFEDKNIQNFNSGFDPNFF